MGNCLKKKANVVELKTNQSEKTNPNTHEKVKHKVKDIVRIP